MRDIRFLILGAVSVTLSSGTAFAASSSNTAAVSVATATTVSQTSTQSVVRTISNSVSDGLSRAFSSGNFFRHGSSSKRVGMGDTSTGVSSGETASGLAAWGSADYTYVRIVPDGDTSQRRLTDIYSGVAGLDYAINDKMLAGVAVSYARAETDGRTLSASKLDQTSDSFTVAPYFGYAPIDNLTIDLVVGYTYSNIDTTSEETGRAVTGSNNSSVLFGAINLGYVFPVTDSIAIKAFTGLSAQASKVDGYYDSRNFYVQEDKNEHVVARVGAKAMVAMTESTQGYFSAAYERESQMSALSENSVRFTLGTSSSLTDGLDLVAEGMANVGRETQQEYGAALNLRMRF